MEQCIQVNQKKKNLSLRFKKFEFLASIHWTNNPKKSKIIPLPDKLESIPILHAFPGATKDYLDGFIDKYKGLIVVSYGSGNVSENMYYAIENVIKNSVKVVLVTNCKYGGVYAE